MRLADAAGGGRWTAAVEYWRRANAKKQSLTGGLHGGSLCVGADIQPEGCGDLAGLLTTDLRLELHEQFIGHAIGLRGSWQGQVHTGLADGQSRQQAANFERFRGGAD